MIKNNFLYALLLLMGILLPLCHSTAQTLPTTESTDEPDITLCQAGQKIPIGNCSDATSFMWSPTTGLTPDSDPKKAQIKVSPTETTVYTRTATRNTASGVVRETWKVRVVVLATPEALYKYLIDLGFVADRTPCTIKGEVALQGEVETRNLATNQVFDYAKLQIQVSSQTILQKTSQTFKAKDILQELEDFLSTKGIISTGFITKNSNICDGNFLEVLSKYNAGSNNLNSNLNIWFHYFDVPNSDGDILLYKIGDKTRVTNLLREFWMNNMKKSTGYSPLTKDDIKKYIENKPAFLGAPCKGGNDIDSRIGYLFEGVFLEYGKVNFSPAFTNFRGNSNKMCQSGGKQPTEPDALADADGTYNGQATKIMNGRWFEIKATNNPRQPTERRDITLSEFQIRDHIDNMLCELGINDLRKHLAEFYVVTTAECCISPAIYEYAENKGKTQIEILADETDWKRCHSPISSCRNITTQHLVSSYILNQKNEMEVKFDIYECGGMLRSLLNWWYQKFGANNTPVLLKCY